MFDSAPLGELESQASRLHATETHCKSAGFNTYETLDSRAFPPITYTSGEPTYGAVTADVNAGLRLPQSRPFSVDTFNSGCVNPHGCVNNAEGGFRCPGPVQTQTPTMRALFDELYAPFAPPGLEMSPPPRLRGGRESRRNQFRRGVAARPERLARVAARSQPAAVRRAAGWRRARLGGGRRAHSTPRA
jgi:hypothetical protein